MKKNASEYCSGAFLRRRGGGSQARCSRTFRRATGGGGDGDVRVSCSAGAWAEAPDFAVSVKVWAGPSSFKRLSGGGKRSASEPPCASALLPLRARSIDDDDAAGQYDACVHESSSSGRRKREQLASGFPESSPIAWRAGRSAAADTGGMSLARKVIRFPERTSGSMVRSLFFNLLRTEPASRRPLGQKTSRTSVPGEKVWKTIPNMRQERS